MQAVLAHEWQADRALAIDCTHHARLFFGSADLGLNTAISRGYAAMSGMVFGEIAQLDAVLASAEKFEQIVNSAATVAPLTQEEPR